MLDLFQLPMSASAVPGLLEPGLRHDGPWNEVTDR